MPLSAGCVAIAPLVPVIDLLHTRRLVVARGEDCVTRCHLGPRGDMSRSHLPVRPTMACFPFQSCRTGKDSGGMTMDVMIPQSCTVVPPESSVTS